MTRIADLDVQLIAHTVFTPPVVEGEDGNEYPIFWPDEANELPTALGRLRQFDGQALAEFSGRLCYMSFDRPNAKTASNADYLLNILRQKHGSVLEHASVSFLIQGVSRSLTHELVRHRHFSFSQLSQRYVDESTLKIVIPPAIEDVIRTATADSQDAAAKLEAYAEKEATVAVSRYDACSEELLERGLSRKQVREAARSVLPNETETKLVVSGNYRAWIEFLIKRDNPAADAEIQRLAREIGSQLAAHAPNVFGPTARSAWDDTAAQQPAHT